MAKRRRARPSVIPSVRCRAAKLRVRDVIYVGRLSGPPGDPGHLPGSGEKELHVWDGLREKAFLIQADGSAPTCNRILWARHENVLSRHVFAALDALSSIRLAGSVLPRKINFLLPR